MSLPKFSEHLSEEKALIEGFDANFSNDDLFEEVIGMEIARNALNEEVYAINEKSEVVDLSPQFWGAAGIKKNDTPDEISKKIGKVYDQAYKAANEQFKALKSQLNKVSQKSKTKKAKVLVDIKSLDSFFDKVAVRGKGAENIKDVLRSAVLLDTPDDVEIVAKQIRKHFKVAEHEVKEKGADKKYGYFGSHHFTVKIGKLFAEIQLMTKKLWSFKHEAHKIYNDLRSKDAMPESKKDKRKAELQKAFDRKGVELLDKLERKFGKAKSTKKKPNDLARSKQLFARGNSADGFKQSRQS